MLCAIYIYTEIHREILVIEMLRVNLNIHVYVGREHSSRPKTALWLFGQ